MELYHLIFTYLVRHRNKLQSYNLYKPKYDYITQECQSSQQQDVKLHHAIILDSSQIALKYNTDVQKYSGMTSLNIITKITPLLYAIQNLNCGTCVVLKIVLLPNKVVLKPNKELVLIPRNGCYSYLIRVPPLFDRPIMLCNTLEISNHPIQNLYLTTLFLYPKNIHHLI